MFIVIANAYRHFNSIRTHCKLNVLASLILIPVCVSMVLRPSKFNFREMRKVSAREKYRHVNEDVSLGLELFWLSTKEKYNLLPYNVLWCRIFMWCHWNGLQGDTFSYSNLLRLSMHYISKNMVSTYSLL